jgi:Tfp pilus assembly protein PilO
LGLADVSEQKKFTMVQILIYIVVFLISGYVSYKLMISPEIKKFQSARAQYSKEKVILKAVEERTQSINALANNAQRLETELIKIRSRVFNEDNEVLDFMRSLPETTNMTGNNLMSIVPLEAKAILEPVPPPPVAPARGDKSKDKSKTTTTQTATAPPAPRTLPCKLKPVEVSFVGGYGDIIRFFDELERLGQYMTVSNIKLTGSYDNSAQVSVKLVLNLLQMGVDAKPIPVQMAKLSQSLVGSNKVTTLVKQTIPVQQVQTSGQTVEPVSTPVTVKQPQTNVKPVQTVTAVKPVQKAAPVQTVKQPQTIKPVQTATAVKPVQTATAVKPVQKVAPVQTVKQPQTNVKPVQTATAASSTQTARTESKNTISRQYAVRVGKFSYYENAKNLANTLKSHQYNAWIKQYSYKGKTTYWVYVGSFETKDKAENFAASMQQKLSYIDDYVIIDVRKGIRRNS